MLYREYCEKDKRRGCNDKIGNLGGCPVVKEAVIPIVCLDMGINRRWDVVAPFWFVGDIAEETISAVVVVDERGGHASR